MKRNIPVLMTLMTLGFLMTSAFSAELFETSVENTSPASAKTAAHSDAGGVDKQSVFLMCPKLKGYSAWSLYLNVDRNNPEKVLSLGLEELQGKNAQDMTYDAMVAAQSDAKTKRKNLGTLDVAKFGSGTINVTDSDALHVSVAPAGKDLRLSLSMRVSFDGRFTVGGKEQSSKDILFKYDAAKKSWSAVANHLKDMTSGVDAANGSNLALTGIVFPVTGTGIYRVVAATTDGDGVVVMDRE